MSNKTEDKSVQKKINEVLIYTDTNRAKLDRKEQQKAKAGDDYINRKQMIQQVEKKLLAHYLVTRHIEDLFSVAIDAGSTQQQIIEQMMLKKRFLSILTNNMTAFRQNSTLEIEKSANEFILTGGKYVALFDALLGNETLNSFDLFYPNVVIIGVSGLRSDDGFYCHGNDEVSVKKLLFQKKVSKILIPADHSKIGRSDSYRFGTMDEFKDRSETTCIVVTSPPVKPKEEKDQETDKNIIEKEVHNYKIAIEKYKKSITSLKKCGIKVDEVKFNDLRIEDDK